MKADPVLSPDSAFPPYPSGFKAAGWLGWAIFLGMSWTWCIGMFLPVLLIHDYGVWAWVIFAVPNVAGAAAMGWVLDRQRSLRMVEAHRVGITAFSVVTVGFQLFFAAWVFSLPSWRSDHCTGYLIGVGIVAAVAAVRKSAKLFSMAILLASIVCAIGLFHHGEAKLALPNAEGRLSATDLPWLSLVCLQGFLFCPYLDATFHRARQNLDDRGSRSAFTVGFGVIFGSAIVLSLLYAGPVYSAIILAQNGAGLVWIKAYWMLQLGLTIGLHLGGDEEQDEGSRRRTSGSVLLAGVALAAIAMIIRATLGVPGETVYLGFIGFYGLVFPAYLWLCVLPGRGVVRPTRRGAAVLALAIVIACPMFFLAFIGHRMGWAGPGVAVVLLSRLLLARSVRGAMPGAAVPYVAQQNSAPTS